MGRIAAAATAFGMGTALTLGGCGEHREIVEPGTGIIVDKYTDEDEVCYSVDPEDFLDCPDLKESTITIYKIDIGACMMQGSEVVLASEDYLKRAAENSTEYPIISEGNALRQGDMDPAKDYSCARTVELSSDTYGRVAIDQLYAVK